MNKICTSPEQSRRLIELGIDVNTADMWWTERYKGRTTMDFQYIVDEEPYYYLSFIKPSNDNYSQDTIKDIPAWSLSALLELIPPYLGEFKDGIDFGFSKAINGKWYSAYYIKLNDNGLASFNMTVTGDTAIDAVFEMIVWLKENKKI